jgi:hypothetical protein
VKANQATHSVREMCRLLKISKSGFYAWDRRPLSARARADIGLTAKIHEIRSSRRLRRANIRRARRRARYPGGL